MLDLRLRAIPSQTASVTADRTCNGSDVNSGRFHQLLHFQVRTLSMQSEIDSGITYSEYLVLVCQTSSTFGAGRDYLTQNGFI